MWAWLRMLRRVPTGISGFLGTTAVSTVSSSLRMNLTWLPFWLASRNPAASRRRLTSRKDWGLSRPNLNLDHANLRRARGLWGLKVQFQRFLQVCEGFFFRLPLARYINIQTLRDKP